MRRDVFQAIADPTRREIINLVANQHLNLNAVAEHFDVSRPAISKHIKILTECGLIEINQQGRERFCEARLEKLNEVNEWIAQYRKFWEGKLDALEEYLKKLQASTAGSELSNFGSALRKESFGQSDNSTWRKKKQKAKEKLNGNRKQKRKSNR